MGVYTVTFRVQDAAGNTPDRVLHVTVSGNRAPTAANDAFNVNEDAIRDTTVLANDTDLDGDTLTILNVSAASHGTASIVNGMTNIRYRPAANYNGTDSFVYTISDGRGGTSQATVTMTVDPMNDNPVAGADTATTNQNQATDINVITNDTDIDGDTLAIDTVSGGIGSAVKLSNTTIRYTPQAGQSGTDSFTYTVVDGRGGSATGNVTVGISAINNVAPIAVDDTAVTNEDAATTLTVLNNDSDADSDVLIIHSVGTPAHGTATILGGNKTLRYTPAADYYGTDSFAYTISDGQGHFLRLPSWSRSTRSMISS